MKKVLALLLAAVMLLCFFSGCEKKNTSAASSASAGNAASTGSTASAASTSGSASTSSAASSSAAGSGSDDGVVLEFQQWFDNEMEAGYLESVCDNFYKETGIRVKLLSNPYADTKTQLQASAVAGTMADIVALDGPWIYDYATQGNLADLGSLFQEIGFDTSDVSMQISVNNKVYAQPLVIFPCLMAVNKDILAAKGITDLPTTWTAFLDDCKKVTDPDNNVYGFAMNMSTDNSTCMEYFAAFAWNSGCSILNEDGGPYLYGNKTFTDTVDFFKSLFDNEVVAPGMFTMTDADKVEEFVNGRVAFMPDSVAHLTNIHEQAPNMNIVYMNMPSQDGYTGPSYMRANNWACGVAANSKHPKEAAQFIAYLLGADVNADLCTHAGGFVVNTKANPVYTDTSDAFKSICDIYKTTTGKAEFYSLPTAEALMKALDEDLIMYIDGDYASADEMLEHTQSVFDEACK